MNSHIIIKLLKIFCINILTFYVYLKINRTKKLNIIDIILIFISSIIATALYEILDKKVSHIFITILIYIVQLIFLKAIIKCEGQSIIITNLIANSITYIGFTVASFIENFPRLIFQISNNVINLIFILCIEFFLLKSLFRFRRFKYGFSFFKNKQNRDYIEIIMINISALLIFMYCLFGRGSGNGDIVKQMIIPFIILGIIMFVMIQKTLTLYYKQKLLAKNIEDYKNEIADKDEQIKKLSDEKFKISKLNHEFYNRQKALEKKVQDFIENANTETASELSVIESINNLSKEYSGKLENIKTVEKLPKTGIEEIDDMFKYMQSECKENNIDFKLQINANIYHMINKIIPKNKLVTLIGDHIRDAIIAINSGTNKFKSIIAIIGINNQDYELCICDTGIEFEIDTLIKLGLEPATTHKETGGSGIGFMTTFETMRETNSSLIIKEIGKPSLNDYTKSVIIKFDGKNEYRICSYRHEKIEKKNKDNRIIIKENNK